jgi:ABC-type Fe3+ transport system permease subunit
MIDMLALEMVFLAVLFAVVVNIRWRRKPRAERPHQEKPHQEKPLQARDWLSPAGIFTAAVIAVAVLTILYVFVRTALQQ